MNAIQKLLTAPESEEILLTATETTKLGSLIISAGILTDKIATLQLDLNSTRSNLATFTLTAGGTQRNILPLLPDNFQLNAGDSLVLTISPALAEENDWVGASGYSYSPAAGGSALPAGLMDKLGAIEGAIAALDGPNPNDLVRQAQVLLEKTITQTGCMVITASPFIMWRAGNGSVAPSSVELGPFELGEELIFWMAGISWANQEEKLLALFDADTGEELIPNTKLETYGSANGSAPNPGRMPTPGLTGRKGKLRLTNTANTHWIAISPLISVK